MTQLEEIQKLYAKAKTYKIPKEPKPKEEQASIVVTPFDLDADMSGMDIKEGAPLKETMEGVKKFIALALGVTVEDVKKLSFEYMEDIVECIMDANNFKGEEKDKMDKLKGFVKSRGLKLQEQPNEQGTGPRPQG